jgi:acetyl esterase/lipase
VQNAERLRTTAFFVAAGSEDFALGGARTLADKLRAAGVPRVQWKEYPGSEHLMIVAAAMEEVFAFFDASAPGGS